MRAVVQRVKRATVRVGTEDVARISRGLLALVAFAATDDDVVMTWMARKIAGLRIFPDDDGKMNVDLAGIDGELLVVSQFTLYGDCTKGKRPSFVGSATPEVGEALYDRFVEIARSAAPGPVATGSFQAHMEIDFVNDGPVTLIIERETS